MQEKFLLIDGNSIFHRAFHAIPALNAPDGSPINAVYGFCATLFGNLEKERPTHIAIAFDKGKKTFRHQEFVEYKAHRKKSPDELYVQLAPIKEIIATLGISMYEDERYEADDLIGTLAHKAKGNPHRQTIILTSDLDTLQLVDEQTYVSSPQGFRKSKYYTPDAVYERYTLRPDQITTLKALKGDSSDNIPGVPGVGEKTAIKLIHEYGSLENILRAGATIPGSLGKKLQEHADLARLSLRLATILLDCDECALPHRFSFSSQHAKELNTIFEKFAFSSLIPKIGRFVTHTEPDKAQQSLF